MMIINLIKIEAKQMIVQFLCRANAENRYDKSELRHWACMEFKT